MQTTGMQTRRWLVHVTLCAVVLSAISAAAPLPARNDASARYIVQSNSATAASAAVVSAGGVVTASLELIDGVAALLSPTALMQLRAQPAIVLHVDAPVKAADIQEALAPAAPAAPQPPASPAVPLLYPSIATGSVDLQKTVVSSQKATCKRGVVTIASKPASQTLAGWGITVAYIDSGLLKMKSPAYWSSRDAATGTLSAEYGDRCLVYRDFLSRTPEHGNAGADANNSVDQNGHGTHVISSVGDYRPVQAQPNTPSIYTGVAPGTNILMARALDKDGTGSYTDVIAAIQWIVANKAKYNVRVLNLSLYAPVNGPYWSDPLNQAVMRAWQSGITVVVAAGNSGPDAGSITVPGNLPYVISVGAIKSGRYTSSGSDELAFYSSRGPTESAFVKPDLLVPASRTIAPIPDSSLLASEIPAAQIVDHGAIIDPFGGALFEPSTYYQLSGTSMAAAQVSGIAALILQKSPALTNDQVKARLMNTARLAIDTTTGLPVYSPWEQGAGQVDTRQAVLTTGADRANIGMDINLDLSSTTHYWGYTSWQNTLDMLQLLDPATGLPLALWDGSSKTWGGSSKTWGGSSKTWGGSSKTWGGSSKTWGGGTSTWAGSDSLWAGANQFWAGTNPSASSAMASQAHILLDDDEPTFTPSGPITPLLECVITRADGSATAFFGYQNDNPSSAAVLFGDSNMFAASQRYHGQPTVFAPGRVSSAFSVDFEGNDLTWLLNGLTATASRTSPACAP